MPSLAPETMTDEAGQDQSRSPTASLIESEQSFQFKATSEPLAGMTDVSNWLSSMSPDNLRHIIRHNAADQIDDCPQADAGESTAASPSNDAATPFRGELDRRLSKLTSEICELHRWACSCQVTEPGPSSIQRVTTMDMQRIISKRKTGSMPSGVGKSRQSEVTSGHLRQVRQCWIPTAEALGLNQDDDAAFALDFEDEVTRLSLEFMRDLLHGKRRGSASSLSYFSHGTLQRSWSAGAFNVRKRNKIWNHIPLHPYSKVKVSWDLVLCFFLLYDLFSLPLESFVFGGRTLLRPLQVIGAVAWTLDFGVSFGTSFYQNAKLVSDFRLIAMAYARHWMLPDVVLMLFDWATIALGDVLGHASGFAQSVRVVRFMRLARLVRIVKVKEKAKALLMAFNVAPFVARIFASAALVVCIFGANHMMACCWVYLGMQTSGAGLDSWTSSFMGSSPARLYLVGLHWSVCQFHGSLDVHPRNFDERMFAVLVVLAACVTFPFFISSVTTQSVQFQVLARERREARAILQEFLLLRNIPSSLSSTAKKYLDLHFNKRNYSQYDGVLKLLPESVRADIYCQIREPHLLYNSFLRHLRLSYPRHVRQLCDGGFAIKETSPDEVVFSTGDACSLMVFVESGSLKYDTKLTEFSPNDASLTRPSCISSTSRRASTIESTLGGLSGYGGSEQLRESLGSGTVLSMEWLCEAALWTKWQNVGRLSSITGCTFLELCEATFERLVALYPNVHADAVLYARFFVLCVAEHGGTVRCTDRGVELLCELS